MEAHVSQAIHIRVGFNGRIPPLDSVVVQLLAGGSAVA
jgi:hypothetical protein